jgi:photosystem II stability/assembly factor-like uncharacterized protein
MNKQLLFTAILAGICSLGNAQWQKLGGYPANGNASSLVVINDTMIASSTGNVYDMTPGLFTSTNHGVTWSAKNTNLGKPASPLITQGGYLYAGTWSQGIYLSTDKGNTWTDKSNGLPSNFSVLDLIINNTDLHACGTGGIFRSGDNGTTWENISLAGTVQASSVIVAGNTILSAFVSETAAGVYKSNDNGAAWTLIDPATGLNDTRIHKFALYYNTIFAASNGDMGTGNVYVSTDNGNTWTAGNGLDDQGHNYPQKFIAFNNTIFLATGKGVYKSSDYGLNWVNTGCVNAMCLAIIGDTLFAGTGYQGIWKRRLSEMAGGIDEIKENLGVAAYPNPSSDKINIGFKQYSPVENTLVSIYSIQGELLFQQPLKNDITELDISGLEKGVYLVKVSNKKTTELTKLVKK